MTKKVEKQKAEKPPCHLDGYRGSSFMLSLRGKKCWLGLVRIGAVGGGWFGNDSAAKQIVKRRRVERVSVGGGGGPKWKYVEICGKPSATTEDQSKGS